ncbi:TetR/AcrR family transcriptional regulator [Paracoccus caeni]|uniref:TetR/AcrR family transcriptional regulator n=1 Tax=Paracoccus caeni TaxID=657651 RepID=A0A934SG37_9RHOB|nr:helix-turn-helix domain-containing protein [Paracoccus caeni]MBK4216789.1 TetR/AcrR family transcriptional regulator [Paracoccus caeni]
MDDSLTARRGRPRTFDEAAVLDAAVEALWRSGVRGLSLNELAESLQTSKPNLARAFGCKEQLIARALERYCQQSSEKTNAVLAEPGTLQQVVARYLDLFVKAHTDCSTPSGCLFSSALSDCSAETEGPVHEALATLSARNMQALQDRLQLAGAADPASLAQFLVGQTVAMSVMARNGADREALQQFAALAARAAT